MADQTKAARFLCPGCSADMEFDPESGGLKCRYCGRTDPLPPPATTSVSAHDLEAALTSGAAVERISAKALEIRCDGCGSVVAFEPPEVAGSCPFCAAALVAQPKASDPLIAPDGVLPAKVPRNKAQKEVQQWLATRWFAPNALKNLARQEGISGVYLPFWDYAADTFSRYTGQRGDYYYESETYTESDGKGGYVQRTRQVRRTRWSPASGQVSRRFEDILIPATQSLNESRLNALEPWDLPSLCTYEPVYLAGFKAQRYQVELPEGYAKAKAAMAPVIHADVVDDIGGDEQRVDHISTIYTNTTFRHLLLPVWIGAYRFQNKVFQVAINAVTGEVQGERPYSALKITALVIFILIVIAILVLVSNQQ